MKKELIFMLTAAALGTVFFSNITADKASAKTSGDYKYVVTGKKKKTCAIRKYLGKDKDVVIPEKIDGYTVTRIGNRAFKDNKNIKSIKLSKGITVIGESSFYDCYNLNDITFPKKLHTIKTKAFEHCRNLKSINLPSKLKTIGKEAFCYCSLEEIHIPQHVESIGRDAFYGITSITVDKRNKKYDSRDNCNAVIETSTNRLILSSKNTTIPDSIIVIGKYAFSSSTIKEIVIPSSVKTIGDYAFDNSRIKEITIPASVTSIGESAFSYNDNLKKINFSDGLETIGEDAFYSCDAIKEINLPDSVETIGSGAFFCASLEKINVPKNLKTDINVLSHSLKYISVAEGNQLYDSRDNCNAVIETATNTLVMGSINTTIPNSVKAIGDYSFFSSPSELVIPEGVESIGKQVFQHCDNLKAITIPSSVKTIGCYAFLYNENLKTINYRGSKAQWENIKIDNDTDSSEEWWSSIKINYDYKG